MIYTTGTISDHNTKLLSVSKWCHHRWFFIILNKTNEKNCCSTLCQFCVFIFPHAVYDITKRSTFLSIQRWIEEVRRYTTSDVILILIGNKCDLEEEREVSVNRICWFVLFVSIIHAMFVFQHDIYSGGIKWGASIVPVYTRNFICHGNVRKRESKYQRHFLFISNWIDGKFDLSIKHKNCEFSFLSDMNWNA